MTHEPKPTVARISGPDAEDTLATTAKAWNRQAFETLFKRHKQKLSVVVQRYTRVLKEAKEIVQQSLMKGFVDFYQFQGQSSFTAWLTSFAISEGLSFLRRVRRPPIFYARKKLRKNLRGRAKHNPMSATHGSCAQC